MAEHVYYGGVEGGASRSSYSLLRSDGKKLASCTGDSTNQYLIGMDECLRRITLMVEEGFEKANLPTGTTLEGLGMSLSGGDELGVQAAIKETAMTNYPTLAKHIFVGSDTQSALATALPKGGVVLIAGTGSNCQLINEDGSMARCGGWGHMIGDEASACWITLKAVKTYFDHEDGMNTCPHSVDIVRDVIFDYFKISDRSEILDHLYKDFDKTKFSGCCKELAKAGLMTKDRLCCWIFREAGQLLGRHLCAVSSKMSEGMKGKAGGVPIVCVGSVFKSWNLMLPGFIQEMKTMCLESGITAVTLYRLETDASVGAAALGARAAGKELCMDYSGTASIFCREKFV